MSSADAREALPPGPILARSRDIRDRRERITAGATSKLGLDRIGIAFRTTIACLQVDGPSLSAAGMTGVAYVIVVKYVAMRQANLAAVTVTARVAAITTNVCIDNRVVAVNGIKTVQAECLCCPSNRLELSLSVSDVWLRFCSL